MSNIDDKQFEKLIVNESQVKAAKSRVRKTVVSSKILSFETSEEDSPLKANIVRIINERKLTYNSLYEFCTEQLADGDVEKGKKQACNLINGLRYHHTMIDTTFLFLCRFLGYEVYLKRMDTKLDDHSDDTKIEKVSTPSEEETVTD